MARLLQTESTLTDRYQTTVPDAVRKALHLGKRDKIRYTVQSDGHVLMTRAEEEEDPVIAEFLNFIAKDIQNNPKNLTTINQDLVTRINSLVANVEVNLDEPLPEDEELTENRVTR
ncbi:HtrA suppressor protein SohA [Legionella pneumophila]|uniref:Regulator n=1 Tax=Legionella pneumophila subsp. pneumophila TaxID=91891 RepID=A0AAV2UVL7_LEGPN|nr:type II toxin-antitoxin system PrlF family antitoxin [Legionella pneumophila]CCD05139.1 putative regulator [Legionella pneumophila subsp. pneumophila]CZH32130.1 HtrA suppressor protein SohA [Legionella pneumophila]CZI18863.1 HtrA suppressor protein SohA [Legionella pneumophila]CZL86660.1 HtrA suppressor protein SohA [Legionella pneumophila]CZL93206.1 HtrA suppressor protein SohA [Legionella pneumophila]